MLHKLFRIVFPATRPEVLKRQYNLPESLTLNVELTGDGWYIVQSPDLPGLITEARSQVELLEMINDAVLTYFDVPKKEADYIYNQIKIGDQIVQYQAQLRTA